MLTGRLDSWDAWVCVVTVLLGYLPAASGPFCLVVESREFLSLKL